MKTVIFTITLLASIAASAVQKMTPEERDLLIQQKVGGFIEIEAKGTILVINCQRLVSLESIEDTISLARKNPVFGKHIFNFLLSMLTIVKLYRRPYICNARYTSPIASHQSSQP